MKFVEEIKIVTKNGVTKITLNDEELRGVKALHFKHAEGKNAELLLKLEVVNLSEV